MKYFFIFFISLLLQNPFVESVHAGAVIGSTFPQQIVQAFTDISTDVSSALTSISTKAQAYDSLIGRPLATSMINLAQQKMADDIINWANGGFQGEPLIISDPGSFIKSAGLTTVKGALSEIDPKSIYGDTIFSTLVDQYKDSDLKTQLSVIGKSNLPSILQANICKDSQLTALVKSQVTDSSGIVDTAALQQKKTELYNYACRGNPSTDPNLAARLNDLNKQKASLAGWDGWLATTGGDNAYTSSAAASNLIAKKVAAEQEQKKNDIFLGQKPQSQKKCLEQAVVKPGEAPRCAEGKEVVLTPGSAVAAALDRAANSGIDRLTNLTEGGLTSAIAVLALNKLAKGLNRSFNNTTSGQTTGSNTGTTVTTTTVFSDDLKGDASTKRSLLDPMTKQLIYYSEQLDKVEVVDKAYLAATNDYQGNVTSVRSCYDRLINDGLLAVGSSPATTAYTVLDDRQNKINTIKGILVPELQKVVAAKNLVVETNTKLAESNSSQEISAIFTAYTATVDDNNYPTAETEGARRAEMMRDKASAESDLKSSRETNQNLYGLQATCDSMRVEPLNGGGN